MSKKQVGGYILDKKIGKGSFAAVWKGHHIDDTEIVAIKVISRSTVHETTQLKQEVAVLKQIDHPNIVRFRDLKKSAGHFYLILEYCEGGDLSKFIRSRGKVSCVVARRFLKQIANGLHVLHQQNFIHRDLKPQNILLSCDSDDAVLKIADFGFARALSPFDMAATICGSPLYMAPEILRHEKYDARADLWSIGAILFELLYGHPPYTASNPIELLKVIESSALELSDSVTVTESCQMLLRSLLVKDPNDRLSTEHFFNHEFMELECVYSVVEPPEILSPDRPCQKSIDPEAAPHSPEGAPGSSAQDQNEPKEAEVDEYVVVTETEEPISSSPMKNWSDGESPFVNNLLQSARMMAWLADKNLEETPVDSFALYLKALGLVDKALKVAPTSAGLQCIFHELVNQSQACHETIQSRGLTADGNANGVIFDFALKHAKDSAIDLSSGHMDVCLEKLRASSLLLELLVSEADGDDVLILRTYLNPILQMIREVCAHEETRKETTETSAPADLSGSVK